jgi:hypothetical protein
MAIFKSEPDAQPRQVPTEAESGEVMRGLDARFDVPLAPVRSIEPTGMEVPPDGNRKYQDAVRVNTYRMKPSDLAASKRYRERKKVK